MINRTDWLQPYRTMTKRLPLRHWVMLGWLTFVALMVLVYLLALLWGTPPTSREGQDSPPVLAAARPEPTLRSAAAERREAAARVSRAGERESRLARSVAPSPSPSPTPTPTPTPTDRTQRAGGMPALLVTIRAHESGGNYRALNPTGCEGHGCGGAYQLHAAYAPTWAARAGYPGMGSNAAEWPAHIQDAVALKLFYSTNPDGSHWCRWVSYC